MEYGPGHAELYDLVFRSRGKDFEVEGTEVGLLIRARFPAADSLLDVACGTGAHLATYARDFGHVEGLEYAPAMADFARGQLSGVTVHSGDMRDFELGRTFDAVTCLGNSVACVSTVEELHQSVARKAAHLVTGGVLVIEPWWFPENYIDGHVGGALVREDDRVVARITHSTKVGLKTRHEVKFVVADGTGITEFSEALFVCLFTRDEYESAFEAAGCAVELVPAQKLADGRPNGPGLFVGVRK